MSEANTTEGQTGQEQTSSTTEGGQQQQQQTQEKPFYEAWAPELKESQVVLRHKTPEDVARSLVAAEKRLGVPADQLVRLPKGADDAEGYAAVMKALGAPDAPEGYKIELADGATDADKAMGSEFAKVMHAAHAPPQVVKAALDFWNAQTMAAAEAATTERDNANAAAETALKEAWGAAYDHRSKEIGRLLNELGGKELSAELDRSGLGSNVQLMTAFGKLLDRMAEPGRLEGGDRGKDTTSVLTPGQAKAKRLELESDSVKGQALTKADHPMHASVVAERNRYLALETAQATS